MAGTRCLMEGAPTCCMMVRSSMRNSSRTRSTPGLTERAQAPDIGPADADGGGAHAQRLGNIGAAAETAVDQDRHSAAHHCDDLRQGVDRRASAVLAPGAVVRDDDAVQASLGGELRVLVREDPFDQELHVGRVAHPLDGVPGHGGGLDAGKTRKIQAFVHRLSLVVRLEAAPVVAGRAIARVGALQPEPGFLVTTAVAIHRHRDCEATGPFRAR